MKPAAGFHYSDSKYSRYFDSNNLRLRPQAYHQCTVRINFKIYYYVFVFTASAPLHAIHAKYHPNGIQFYVRKIAQ